MTDDERYMARCLQLARRGELTTAPNPMVGAVIVHDGRIIGEGWHRAYGGPHAEVNAVRSVSPADEQKLCEATIYVSLEPCSHWGKTPPCAELLAEKRFKRVVVATEDPNEKVAGRGLERLREAGADVTVGILRDESRWLNRKFFMQHEQHRPWITLKWAQSADGYIDRLRESRERDGEAVHFSTPWTQMLVHQLRATHEAILVGRRTWELDCPALTTREWPGKSPVKLPPLSYASYTIADVIRSEHQSVLVEGGSETLQSFIDADLWDEAFIEYSDIILGNGVKAPEIKTDPKGRPIHVNFA